VPLRVPKWVVHTEKGDGGLSDSERRTVGAACSTVTVVTIPGKVIFLPHEVPDQIASVVNDAAAAVNSDSQAGNRHRTARIRRESRSLRAASHRV
jgi:hypothetical protein